MNHILSLLFLFSSISCSFGQKLEDNSTTFHVKENGIAMNFTALDLDEKGVKRYNTDTYYFWYKAQKVLITQGGSSGQLLDGKYEAFYSNKQLKEAGEFIKGTKVGTWKCWNDQGYLIRIEHWNRGKLSGRQETFDQKGKLVKTTFIKGSPIAKSHDTLVTLGKHSQTIQFYDTLGRLTEVARYKNGVLDGKQELVAADGTKTISNYKKGELQKDEQVEKNTSKEKVKKPSLERIQFWKKDKPAKESDKKKVKEGKKGKTVKEEPPTEPKPKKKLFKQKTAE